MNVSRVRTDPYAPPNDQQNALALVRTVGPRPRAGSALNEVEVAVRRPLPRSRSPVKYDSIIGRADPLSRAPSSGFNAAAFIRAPSLSKNPSNSSSEQSPFSIQSFPSQTNEEYVIAAANADRKERLEKLETDLDRWGRKIEKRKENLGKEEKELDTREEELNKRRNELNRQENELERKEQEVKRQEAEYERRKSARELNRRLARLDGSSTSTASPAWVDSFAALQLRVEALENQWAAVYAAQISEAVTTDGPLSEDNDEAPKGAADMVSTIVVHSGVMNHSHDLNETQRG